MGTKPPTSADECFDHLLVHLQNGPGNRAWCDFALASERRGFWLKLDWRDVPFNSIREAVRLAVNQLEGWRDKCDPSIDERALPTLTALLNGSVFEPSADDDIQSLRPEVLSAGMMVGILHPGSELRTLSHTTGRLPFRTTHHYLNVRYAIERDLTFLSVNDELHEMLAKQVR